MLGTGGQQLAPHLGADDADRVPQDTGVVRTTGDLGRAALLLGGGADDVHVGERDVEVVGDLHSEGGQEPLADVLAGAFCVDPVVGLDLDLEVIERGLLAGDEDVGEVLGVRDLVGLRREGAGTVGESQTAGHGQRRPCDQEPLQDLSTFNSFVEY